MPRVVPSQVVEFIDRAFPGISRDALDTTQNFQTNAERIAELSALLELVDAVPNHLLIVDSRTDADLRVAVSVIRATIHRVEYGSLRERCDHGFPALGVIRGGWSPIIIVRRAFERCPDDAAIETAHRLPFVTDPQLRDDLRRDLSSIETAINTGEWKAATVLAGSASEALLLWALRQQPLAGIESVVAALVEASRFGEKSRSDLLTWHLPTYIEVAHRLKLIDDDTATQAKLGKEYRKVGMPLTQVDPICSIRAWEKNTLET